MAAMLKVADGRSEEPILRNDNATVSEFLQVVQGIVAVTEIVRTIWLESCYHHSTMKDSSSETAV